MTKRKGNDYNVARAADLAASGLNDAKVIKKLRFGDALDPEATANLTGLDPKRERAVCYEIPYFDVHGAVVEYSRWKIIGLEDRLISMRYYQHEKTIPRAYLPPLLDWQKIARDPTQRIVITEGEKKAACACLHKLACIGLGGVWNWKARGWLLDKIPDFDAIVWKDRVVEICFDGDLHANENVARAMQALVALLVELGAVVYIRYLSNTDSKTGLDDFLVAKGAKAYEKLPLVPAKESAALLALNSELVYIEHDKLYYSTAGIAYRGVEELRKHYLDTMPAIGNRRPELAIDAWVRWRHRRGVAHVTYAPERPVIHDDAYNLWRPSGIEAKRGDVSVFRRIVAGFGTQEFQAAFWQWLAYPIQHPGTKINWAVVLWSVPQGTGKSFVGDVMRDIYGKENSKSIGAAQLYSDRNVWIRNMQFVVAEELTKSNDHRAPDRLKDIITGETVIVNEKFVPEHSLPNLVNLLLCSNHSDAVHIESADRRYMVAEVHNDPSEDNPLWAEAKRWRAEGGAAALKWYLLNEVDCSKFNPKGRAPMTADKAAMIYESKTGLGRWATDLIANPDTVFGDTAKTLKGRSVFTIEQLKVFLPEDLRDDATLPAISKALIKEGMVRLQVVAKVDGKAKRLVAVRNLDYWRQHPQEQHKELWIADFKGNAAPPLKRATADNVTPLRRKS